MLVLACIYACMHFFVYMYSLCMHKVWHPPQITCSVGFLSAKTFLSATVYFMLNKDRLAVFFIAFDLVVFRAMQRPLEGQKCCRRGTKYLPKLKSYHRPNEPSLPKNCYGRKGAQGPKDPRLRMPDCIHQG